MWTDAVLVIALVCMFIWLHQTPSIPTILALKLAAIKYEKGPIITWSCNDCSSLAVAATRNKKWPQMHTTGEMHVIIIQPSMLAQFHRFPLRNRYLSISEVTTDKHRIRGNDRSQRLPQISSSVCGYIRTEKLRTWRKNNDTKSNAKTKFMTTMKAGETTYPDEQLYKDNIANCCCNVQWSAQIGVAVRQIDTGRRRVSKNQQRAADVLPCDGIKQLLTTTKKSPLC